MKSILVSGAGGYIGVPLCQSLLEKGYAVTALDRYFFGMDKIAFVQNATNLSVLKDDIRYFDPSILNDVDMVIDLAGLSNDASAEIDFQRTVDINYKGAVRLATEAQKRGVRRFIYSSSASVYGSGAKTELTEDDSLSPLTEYARSKVGVEKTLHELDSGDFETVILRNATVFGLAPRMRFDLAINIMTLRAWKENCIYVMGGGEQWRPFVHVNDVVAAMMACVEADSSSVAGQTFNVGSNAMNYQIKHLAQLVLEEIPNAELHIIPDDPDKRTYNVNFDKIRTGLGFEPSYDAKDGIREILDALRTFHVDGDDPTAYTLQWYKALLEWDRRIAELAYDGEIL